MSLFHRHIRPAHPYKLRPSPHLEGEKRFLRAPRCPLPEKIDLSGLFGTADDQGQAGYCFAFAGKESMEAMHKAATGEALKFSPRFLGYNVHAAEGTLNDDCGGTIADAIDSLIALGVCREESWLYDTTQLWVKPSDDAYSEALKYQGLSKERIDIDVDQIKTALSLGFPVPFGFQVYESFESQAVAQTGEVPMPKPWEQCMGGHGVIIKGCDDTKRMNSILGFGGTVGAFLVRNSWGPNWGSNGDFWLPYAYITPDRVSDAWAITKAE